MSEVTVDDILKALDAKGGPEGLNLSGKDLSDLDLSKEAIQAAISRQDLKTARWTWLSGGADLWHANLEATNLARANLESADLREANLKAACLEKAKLRSANLQEAHLGSASLPGASLESADLRKAYLELANLESANLSRAHLESAILVGACLRKANLRMAQLKGARLMGADLRFADFSGADLESADLSETQLESANLTEANLKGAKLWKASLRGIHAWWASLESANLFEADLEEANLGLANLESGELFHANLKGANLQGARLDSADLRGANLWSADLRMCKLRGADLRGADLRETLFYSAVLNQSLMARGQLGEKIGDELSGRYHEARDAYLRLKRNFESLGDYSAASWAHRKERQMAKFCHAPWNALRYYREEQLPAWGEKKLEFWHPQVARFYLRHTSKWLGAGLVEILCGYGESIWRVFGWMIALLVASALTYRALNGVMAGGEISYDLRDYFLYALGSMTMIRFHSVQAANALVEALSGLQTIAGVFLIGLLGFVAGNRIRRS